MADMPQCCGPTISIIELAPSRDPGVGGAGYWNGTGPSVSPYTNCCTNGSVDSRTLAACLGRRHVRRDEVDVVDDLERFLHVVRDDDRRRAERIVQAPDQLPITPSEIGSSPVNGSSYMISIGSSAIARASATRRAMPPESSAGMSYAAPRRPTLQLHQHQIADQGFRQARVLAQRESHVLEHRIVGEQRAELEQHAHAPAQLIELVVVESSWMRCPATLTVPRVGLTWPPINRSSVVLPEPLSPMIATTLPRGTTMSIPVSTGRAP